MRPLAAMVALAGLAGVSAALLSSGDFLTSHKDPAAVEIVPANPEAVAQPDPAVPLLPVPSRVRPVAPDVVAAPLVEQEGLERIDPREALGIGRVRAPSEGPPAETMLHRPVATAAGAFEARGYHVALSGIEVTDADETCGSDGASWPCGVHARTAFRNWLRGRALSCVVPPVAPQDTVVTECKLGGHDTAAWLVAQGWVRAVADGPYAEMEAEAREKGRGLFGAAPSSAAPPPLTVTLPETSGG
ncbi:MAG: thermonuclease family protein [Neoaquamicrobium sediminum]|uniref:thermonuclease family protein n=1 Tax=Neoaquamicrobium sediminum TaxID=1849104 RepID=UPI004036146C